MIPDIKIHEIIKACLVAVRDDYATNGGTPIFINRDENHPKYLDTRLFFDRERAPIPTIHIMVSGESKGADGIGFDQGFNPEQVIGTDQRPVYNRQYNVNANIVVTSDNAFEALVIYHVVFAMLISINEHIQLVGFINPTFGSRDISISQELVPSGVFAKSISFSGGYELSVPATVLNQIVSNVWIQMKDINNTPVSPYVGPGPLDPNDPDPISEVKDITNP
jgi:hypothetical protein